MLAADKLQLQSALKQQATALKEKEFTLHHSNMSTLRYVTSHHSDGLLLFVVLWFLRSVQFEFWKLLLMIIMIIIGWTRVYVVQQYWVSFCCCSFSGSDCIVLFKGDCRQLTDFSYYFFINSFCARGFSPTVTVGTQAAVLAGLDITMFIEFNPPNNAEWVRVEVSVELL